MRPTSHPTTPKPAGGLCGRLQAIRFWIDLARRVVFGWWQMRKVPPHLRPAILWAHAAVRRHCRTLEDYQAVIEGVQRVLVYLRRSHSHEAHCYWMVRAASLTAPERGSLPGRFVATLLYREAWSWLEEERRENEAGMPLGGTDAAA